jgi:hypothetical protein
MKNKMNEEKKLDNSVYSLMVMGQVGQIDFFESNAFKVEKPTAAQATEWYTNNLKKETYNLESHSCKVTHTVKDPTTNNDSTITTDLENDKGMENFKRLLSNSDVKDLYAKSNALLLLGDIVNTGSSNLLIDGKLENNDLWLKRLRCGWNLFYRNLEKFNTAKVIPLDFSKPATSTYKIQLYGGTEIIPGTSSFDIDINEEKKIYQEISRKGVESKFYDYHTESFGPYDKLNWDLITYSPKLTTISFHSKFYIQFLDFDSDLLICAKPTEDQYKACNKEKKLHSVVEYSDVMSYLEKVQLAIMKFRKDTNKEKTWRVMRTTVAPLNSELGDPEFYFKDFAHGKTQINLFKAMKDMSVEIFISSSMRNAQVISIPYNVEHKFKDFATCAEIEYEIYGCYESKPGKFDTNPLGSKNCDDKLLYDLPVRDLTDTSATSSMLHVFNIGNSGRDLTKIRGGKLAGGILIWARSLQESKNKFNNGFLRFNFDKVQAEVSFYEVDTQNMMQVGKFIVAPAKVPNAEVVQKYLNEKCTKNRRFR